MKLAICIAAWVAMSPFVITGFLVSMAWTACVKGADLFIAFGLWANPE